MQKLEGLEYYRLRCNKTKNFILLHAKSTNKFCTLIFSHFVNKLLLFYVSPSRKLCIQNISGGVPYGVFSRHIYIFSLTKYDRITAKT